MAHQLCEASLHVTPGQSVAVPLVIDGLPNEIVALGERWRRKREFHLTVISAASLERVAAGRANLWDDAITAASGRRLGPITLGADVRRATHPDDPGLHTLVVMAHAGGLASLYDDLSATLGAHLAPPPAHVTLYSTDAARGIRIDDEDELEQRAPALSPAEQAEVRAAMRFDEVLPDDDGIPAAVCDDEMVALGGTDRVFTPRAMRALAYAAHVHRHQRRKATGIPYLAHLISVAALVSEDGGDETEVIAALLHDAAEDHGGEPRLEDIGRRFGPEIASYVRALSDSLRPEAAFKEPWRPRKERYLAHLREEQRPGVLRVSNADKLHNARAIVADHRHVGEAIWNRFDGSPAQQLWYYSSLAEIFLERRPQSPLARELAETIAQLRTEMETTLSDGHR